VCLLVSSSNSTGESVQKLVFLVFFKSAAIEAKIKKIADAFGAKRYPVPGTYVHNTTFCITTAITSTITVTASIDKHIVKLV
jgi:V-type ATPase 116kDa subunit family